MIRRRRAPTRPVRRPATGRRASRVARPRSPSRPGPAAKRAPIARPTPTRPPARRKSLPERRRRLVVYARPLRRRPYRWRRRYWGSPWPYWPVEDVPDGRGGPASDRLNAPANRTLRRLGLLDGVWQVRWTGAAPELVRFVNRFHRAAGIARLLEDYYRDRYRRAVARMAMRLSVRLAADDPDYARNLHFDRLITFAPDSSPIVAGVVGYKGLHYRLFPWRQLHSQALRRQLRRDQLTYKSPDKVRWVFPQRSMKDSGELRSRLRRVLEDGGGPTGRRWPAGLSQTALLI